MGWTAEGSELKLNKRWHFFTSVLMRLVLVLSQSPVQRGTLRLLVKQPGREADHSPPTSAEVIGLLGAVLN
jgi:hypothetical protein